MISRREFLQITALLPIATTSLPVLARFLDDEKGHYFQQPSFIDHPVDLFSPAQRQLVSAIAETIIPRTDTPGATDAGVSKFIELMAAEWMTESERRAFLKGLAGIDPIAKSDYGQDFASCDANQRETLLEQMEDAASDHPWYDLGNIDKEYEQEAPFICQIKELTVFGFFTSEVGASQVLRHTQMPGRFDPDVPLAFDDNSWSPMPEV